MTDNRAASRAIDIALEMVVEARAEERARCLRAAERWTKPSHIRQHAGEMTAQEMRSVVAVVRAIAADIQSQL